TMPLARPTRQIPDAAWTTGIREMTEPWKGALGCLGVAVFFAMTIGIISWPGPGAAAGVAVIAVGGVPAAEPPPPRDRCWHDGGQFCYAWEEDAELRLSLEPSPAPGTECYGVHWTPLRPDVTVKDCFSMANISWYGGGSVRTQRWPLNGAESHAQPFVSGDFSKNPAGYGPVLERYFLGSTGVTVTVAPDVPLFLSLESSRHFCLETPAGRAAEPLRYLLCLSPDVVAAHQHVGSRLAGRARALPDTALLGSPIWHYHGPEGSAAKIKRGLRALAKRLKRHHLEEGVLALGERGTAVLAAADDVPAQRRKRHEVAHAWDAAPLQLSITLSPVPRAVVAAPSQEGFQASNFHPVPQVPLLTTWKGQLCARLNVTSEAALSWFLARARHLRQALGAAYVVFEGAEGNAFLEQAVPPPAELAGDGYTEALAAALATLGNATIISAGARSSHLPLFVQMSPLHSDWSYSGLKGLIPSVLHYSLLGYNFFIPDAVGGSLASDAPADPELYVRWLQIVTFLPVMAFSTPPWLCCDAWVLNLTRQCIKKHQDFVVPLLVKYSEEWLSLGHPIFRPVWWLSPTDPTAFTIEDEFLIGDEVLVAPITEKGQTRRDIYLPGAGHLWMDTSTARVFDGGTVLGNFSASLAEVPVFVK
ncbi:SITS-binding protein, partial [Cuculus canorus]